MTTNTFSNLVIFRSAQLEFDLALGTIKNRHGEVQRLSPINLKLLAYLLGNQGTVISRTDLFDKVWPNQIVSDDVLTRAMSDIRTQLAKLDESTKFIETIPKRGYRWAVNVLPFQGSDNELPAANPVHVAAIAVVKSPKAIHVKAVLLYLSLAVVLACATMWALAQSMSTGMVKLAMLPAQTNRPSGEATAKALDEFLLKQLRKNPQIQLLSQSAIASRPQNPFPYFFNEFGAKWVLESRVTDLDGEEKVELSLVDARTGIEVKNSSVDVVSRTEMLTKVAQKLELDLLVEYLPY